MISCIILCHVLTYSNHTILAIRLEMHCYQDKTSKVDVRLLGET